MKTDYYFDGPDEGPTRETSHPRFREVAVEDFYYDCTDDFSPFGNDDGADTLSDLEDWYREGGRDDKVSSFLQNLISDWDFGVPPKLLLAESAEIEKWLAKDHIHERFLTAICNAYVATAFGQLKITGQVRPEIRMEGLAAIDCQVRLNHILRKTHPDWKHADENLARLVKMRSALEAT